MKIHYLFAASLIFFIGGYKSPDPKVIDNAALSGNISITLKRGLWKSSGEEIFYQDITLDLVCEQARCEGEIWAHAPQFNQADHQGTVKIIGSDRAWRLQVKMTISPDPWQFLEGEANYVIEFLPYQNQLMGSYSGTFNNQQVYGEVSGTIRPHWPKPLPDHLPVSPREHPRLIFRRHQLPALRKKAQTDYGKVILAQLRKTLTKKIDYEGYVPNSGYHAAGHCFLSLLNGNQQGAETAWQIVENSMNQPGPRLLEQSPIVAGVALAYDFCYDAWDEERLKRVTSWLAQETEVLIEGTPDRGWNGYSWSNWSARARGAAGLAALAIMYEPDEFFSKPTKSRRLLKIAERNVKRYLTIAIGEHGFGSEGDHYTTEPWILTILPFLQAYKNVVGKDLVQGSSAEWFLPHYIMRMVSRDNSLNLPTYGRHRRGPGGSLFAIGLGTVPEGFLPGVMWFFNRHLGWGGDKSFGISAPQDAAFALMGYREDVVPRNPAEIFGRVLVDEQKGFYVFRDRWQDENDFVASIYLKRQTLRGSWSFPDAGSFRIWGLGEKWAKAGPSNGKRESENVVLTGKTAWKDAQPTFFESHSNGSGVVSMSRYNWLRSFAVDYSGASGAPGLFVVVDKFTGEDGDKTWVMHTEGKVAIEGQSFTIQAASGATMQGTFITPDGVQISFQPGKDGGSILATGGNEFFVVMTVQKGSVPEVQISGTGLDAQVQVGGQTISFREDRIVGYSLKLGQGSPF